MADDTTLPPGSGGDTIATDEVSSMNGAASLGVKVQRVKVQYGDDGVARDVSPGFPLPVTATAGAVYRLLVPSQAVGANKVMADLFNAAGSGKSVRVLSAMAFVDSDTAVTGTLGVELMLTRTTAVGTGGTAATNEGTSTTVPVICAFDTNNTLPAAITARAAPTGGGAGGAVLARRWVFTEETSAPAGIQGAMGAQFIHNDSGAVIVREGQGLRFVQGAVASVGNIAFEITFELI